MKYHYSLSNDNFIKKDFNALKRAFHNKRYTMGSSVKKFENQLCKWLKVKNAIMVNSGSSANLLLISSLLFRTTKKLKLKKGDEILVPALTWPTTIWPIVQLGFKPVVVDINLDSLAIDLNSAEKSLTSKTKAIFLIHVLGQACNMDKYLKFCKKNKLILLEDCCESFGAFYKKKTVGSFGYAGTLSHYFSHHLTTIEGGTIITNDNDLANDLRSLRSHGWIRDRSDSSLIKKNNKKLDPRFLFLLPGFNFRPMEFQGILGSQQLKKINILLKKREETAKKIYTISLNGPNWLKIIGSEFINNKRNKNNNARRHSWMQIPFISINKKININKVKEIFENDGIETRPIISGNITKHPVFKKLNIKTAKNLINSDVIHNSGFMIGCNPFINKQSIQKFKNVFAKLKNL